MLMRITERSRIGLVCFGAEGNNILFMLTQWAEKKKDTIFGPKVSLEGHRLEEKLPSTSNQKIINYKSNLENDQILFSDA